MKSLTTILFFFLAVSAGSAQGFKVSPLGYARFLKPTLHAGSSEPVLTFSTDRHFVVTFVYLDRCGYLKKGEFGWKSKNPYPKGSDLVIRASDLTGTKCKDIYIVGVDTIGKADYEALFSKN